MDGFGSQLKGLQSLHISSQIKGLENPINTIHEHGTTMILDSSISGHLENLVTRTNIHTDKINAVAATKLQLMEDILLTMASTLDFAFNAKTSLQQRIETSQKQCQIFNKMEKQFEAKWLGFEDNAETLLAISRGLEIIKDRGCTSDMCAQNCKADKESVDKIKESIKNLWKIAYLAKKPLQRTKTKVNDMCVKFIPKNEPMDQNNDTRDNKNESSPPIRENPYDHNAQQTTIQGTKNSQSRHYEKHNGCKENSNGYSQL